jgi:hypothetical protein
MELYHQIKSVIQSKTCPLHNLHPVVDISPDFLNINCCCDLFKAECIADIQVLLKESNNVKAISVSKKGRGKQ